MFIRCHGVNIKSYPVIEIENFRTDDKNYLDFRNIVKLYHYILHTIF